MRTSTRSTFSFLYSSAPGSTIELVRPSGESLPSGKIITGNPLRSVRNIPMAVCISGVNSFLVSVPVFFARVRRTGSLV